MAQHDHLISDFDIGNPEDDGLIWVGSREVLDIVCQAADRVWPDAVWSMNKGGIQIGTRQLLDDYNAGPVIAWRAEQIWELVGRVIHGRMVADIVDHPTTTFGAKLRGYRCNRLQVPVIATIGVLAILHQSGGSTDEMVDRFLRRFDMMTADVRA